MRIMRREMPAIPFARKKNSDPAKMTCATEDRHNHAAWVSWPIDITI